MLCPDPLGELSEWWELTALAGLTVFGSGWRER